MPHAGENVNAPPKMIRLQDAAIGTMSDTGQCMSMHQPLAGFLVRGIKIHEGRTWYTPHRGRLWIAATAQQPADEDVAQWQATYQAVNPRKPFVLPLPRKHRRCVGRRRGKAGAGLGLGCVGCIVVGASRTRADGIRHCCCAAAYVRAVLLTSLLQGSTSRQATPLLASWDLWTSKTACPKKSTENGFQTAFRSLRLYSFARIHTSSSFDSR